MNNMESILIIKCYTMIKMNKSAYKYNINKK